MKNLLKSKRGDLPDMLVFIITIFILGFGLFLMAFIIPEIAGGLGTAGLNESAEGSDAVQELVFLGTVGLQRGFLFLFVGLIASLMITSFLVRTHPMFIFLYILFLGVTAFLGTYLGNAYEQATSSPILAETLASQGLITVVMQNIVMITLAVGALSMIIVFSKFTSIFGGRRNAGI